MICKGILKVFFVSLILAFLCAAMSCDIFTAKKQSASTSVSVDSLNARGFKKIGDSLYLFGGDMVFNTTNPWHHAFVFNEGSELNSKGLVNLGTAPTWPSNCVLYRFDSSISDIEKANVITAMTHITNGTGIIFQENTTDNTHVICIISRGTTTNSMYAMVGHVAGSYLHLTSDPNINSSSTNTPKIIHELCHVLGLFHEHQRPDRDAYITVNTSNVKDAVNIPDFAPLSSSGYTNLNTLYDFASIMHYGPTYFAIPGTNTITLKPQYQAYSNVLGLAQDLSEFDKYTIKTLYNIPATMPVSVTTTTLPNLPQITPSTRITGNWVGVYQGSTFQAQLSGVGNSGMGTIYFNVPTGWAIHIWTDYVLNHGTAQTPATGTIAYPGGSISAIPDGVTHHFDQTFYVSTSNACYFTVNCSGSSEMLLNNLHFFVVNAPQNYTTTATGPWTSGYTTSVNTATNYAYINGTIPGAGTLSFNLPTGVTYQVLGSYRLYGGNQILSGGGGYVRYPSNQKIATTDWQQLNITFTSMTQGDFNLFANGPAGGIEVSGIQIISQ